MVMTGYPKLQDRRFFIRYRLMSYPEHKVNLEVMVMKEREDVRPTFVLDRGMYDAPGEVVSPGTPTAFSDWKEEMPPNRLGLAQWLVSPDHPLTARVAVNRYWQLVFGEGLVRTPEDFGNQGELPTHPRLLDWLARDFVESGWDIRRLLRTFDHGH